MPGDTIDLIDGFEAVRHILTAAWEIAVIPAAFNRTDPEMHAATSRGLISIAIALNDELDAAVREMLQKPSRVVTRINGERPA